MNEFFIMIIYLSLLLQNNRTEFNDRVKLDLLKFNRKKADPPLKFIRTMENQTHYIIFIFLMENF